MPFQASSIIDELLSPCLHWRVHMVFSTWKSYFAHQSSLLEQHGFPGHQLIDLSVVIEKLPFSSCLSCFTSSLIELVPAVDFHLAQQSTVQLPSSSSRLFPDLTPVQPVLCCNWNKCSRPQIISWVSTAWVFTLRHFTTCCLPRINCFYWGERCTDTAARAGESRKSGLKCLRKDGEGGGGKSKRCGLMPANCVPSSPLPTSASGMERRIRKR